VLLAAVGFDDRLFAPFFVSRLAPFYPLVAVLLSLWVWWARPGVCPFVVCVGDVVAVALAGWLALGAILSPAPVVAWLGYYNRGAGAWFWIALLVLALVARRLLAGRPQIAILVVFTALAVSWAALVALLQARGVETWWRAGGGWPGRWTGTTGNPINLAGLSLLAAWLGVLATGSDLRSWLRAAAGVGCAFGLVGTALAVTRASYLGLAAALVVVAVGWVYSRRWRALAVVGALLCVLLVGGLVQLSSGGGRTVLQRFQATRTAAALSRSDSKRVQLWREALQATADRPLVGYGAGAFVVADRLHRPAARLVSDPWNVATDPHSVPLLLAAVSGVPGVLLGAALCVLAALALVRRPRRLFGTSPEASRAEPVAGLRLAALAYAVACLVYLLVSPLDLVVAAPLVLLVGAAVGPPSWSGRLRWRVPAVGRPTAARTVWIVALVACGAVFIVATAVGVRFYRADLEMGTYAAGDDARAIVRAADLFPWEPLYTLESGAREWRDGLAANDSGGIERGRAETQKGIDLDRTGPMGHADLARLAIAQGRYGEVENPVRAGLRWAPDHPILQGLWAAAAYNAVVVEKDRALGQRLLNGIESYGPTTPDAWHWIGMTDKALGDDAAADAAFAQARKLAPRITDNQYEQRLRRGH
jgi:O-antigen ligase